MATILWPLLIAVLGLLIYVLAGSGGQPAPAPGAAPWYGGHSGKVSELGRIAYFCGLFWVVWLLTNRAFHF